MNRTVLECHLLLESCSITFLRRVEERLSSSNVNASEEDLFTAVNRVLSIGSTHDSQLKSLASNVVTQLPACVATTLEEWNVASPEFPAVGAWVSFVAFCSLP